MVSAPFVCQPVKAKDQTRPCLVTDCVARARPAAWRTLGRYYGLPSQAVQVMGDLICPTPQSQQQLAATTEESSLQKTAQAPQTVPGKPRRGQGAADALRGGNGVPPVLDARCSRPNRQGSASAHPDTLVLHANCAQRGCVSPLDPETGAGTLDAASARRTRISH
jgi:hypothetical protein